MTVVALAGRRPDPENSAGRFPAAQMPVVRERIRDFLLKKKARAVVCSAAAGADLLALGAAGDLGLRRRVVLPFTPERFRETSVIDRGGDWGSLYDRVIRAVGAANDLVVLRNASEEADAYARANLRVLDEAQSLATTGEGSQEVIVAIVWDGTPRSPDDLTAHFGVEARARGLDVFEIPTL